MAIVCDNFIELLDLARKIGVSFFRGYLIGCVFKRGQKEPMGNVKVPAA